MRIAILLSALAFVGLLTFLTVDVALRAGITPLVGVSILVLALFVFGIVSALLQPPEE
ncbi:MAG TPA: hypothetical protein VGV40_01620 [Solirubrobacteraceae bacterium]|nr:hypothetical protein [Solirubrobacteraceae bacterium]